MQKQGFFQQLELTDNCRMQVKHQERLLQTLKIVVNRQHMYRHGAGSWQALIRQSLVTDLPTKQATRIVGLGLSTHRHTPESWCNNL